MLEGSVRKAGDRLRVTGQLVDAETGAHLWADRYDGQVEDVFDLQDRITEAVVGAIAPEIRNAEIERAVRNRPMSLDAYDLFLRAQAAINQFRLREADERLAQAITLASDYVEAKALRAWLQTLFWSKHAALTDESLAFACQVAEEVVGTPGADIESKAYAGYTIALLTDEFDRGLSHVTRATELCPSCLSAQGSGCLLNGMHGDKALAIAHGEEALRLNPRDPLSYRVHLGMATAHLIGHEWQEMLTCADRARFFFNHVLSFRVFEIAGNVKLGQVERARRLAEQLLALDPAFTITSFREKRRHVRAMAPRGYEPLYDGLLSAGVPE